MSRRTDTDELRLLVECAQNRDAEAWEALYRRSRPKLFRFARRRLPSDEAADDAVSEAFMRAIGKIDGFSWAGAGFDAWMYGITRNIVHEHNRRLSRDAATTRKEAGSIVLDQTTSDGDVGAEFDADAERSQVRQAFDRLDEADREILELRVIGGLTSAEVATVLGITSGAVRMAQSRAVGRLRIAMDGLDHA